MDRFRGNQSTTVILVTGNGVYQTAASTAVASSVSRVCADCRVCSRVCACRFAWTTKRSVVTRVGKTIGRGSGGGGRAADRPAVGAARQGADGRRRRAYSKRGP